MIDLDTILEICRCHNIKMDITYEPLGEKALYINVCFTKGIEYRRFYSKEEKVYHDYFGECKELKTNNMFAQLMDFIKEINKEINNEIN